MINSSFLYLVYNTSLLLLLVFLFDIFSVKWRSDRCKLLKIPFGIVIGLIGIIVMQTHWTLESGAIFDTRSILVSISGLYFGPVPTLIAMLMTSLFRVYQGGIGVYTGISVIICTGSIGLIWRVLSKKELKDLSFGNLYIFGIVIHFVMLALMLTFPKDTALNVLKTITLPVLLIYPAGTALLGTFMTNRLQRESLTLKIIEEETKFKILADHTTNWDYWTGPDKTFKYCSPSCFIITGYSNQEFIENPKLLRTIVHPDDLVWVSEHMNFSDKELPGHIDFRIIHKNGSERWIGHSCVPIYNSERVFLGTRSSNRDITVQKVAERKLYDSREEIKKLLEVTDNSRLALLSVVEDQKIATERLAELNSELERRVEERTSQLAEANKELEAFSYSISHDLRAPLRGVSGFANILVEDYSPNLDDNGKRLCNSIIDNARNMSRLIDDLLSFSRLSRKEILKSEIKMGILINSIYHEVTNEIQRDKIEFEIGEIADCFADPSLIRQVLTNYLSNAVKYTSKKEIPTIKVTSLFDGNKIVYCFTDNGAGFDMKYSEKLFGVFQRLHSVSDFEGTGVGLAISQRIIHRHGGEVGAEGKVDNGATFWFSLPKE